VSVFLFVCFCFLLSNLFSLPVLLSLLLSFHAKPQRQPYNQPASGKGHPLTGLAVERLSSTTINVMSLYEEHHFLSVSLSMCVCLSLCVVFCLVPCFFQEGAVLVDLVSVILKGQQQQNDEFSKKKKKKKREKDSCSRVTYMAE